MDPYGGSADDPQSLHKYTYTHCDPVNFVDPSGMQGSLMSVMAVVTISATLLSIAVPVLGALVLNARGKVSIFGVLRNLIVPPDALITWGAAIILSCAAVGVAAGVKLLLLKLGPRLVLRAALAAVFAVFGLGVAIYQTWKLVAGDIPPDDADRYVAIMIASILLSVFLGAKVLNPSGSKPDASTIARWGRPGLEPGDWVMVGEKTWYNYFMTFKWQPGAGNRFSAFEAGEVFNVNPSEVQWPKGWGIDGWWKGLFGQRIYVPQPPPVPPG